MIKLGIELNNDQIFAELELEHWYNSGMNQLFQISGGAGTGKAQPIDTPIPTPDGYKLLGDLKVGDYVFNRKGKPVKILGVYDQGKLEAFRVTLDDSRSTICNDEHIWSYYENNSSILQSNTLSEIMKRPLIKGSNKYRYEIPLSEPIEYEEKVFTVSPYIFGKFLNKTPKNIPDKYFFGSIKQRWSLIKGIFDLDCNINNINCQDYSYTSTCLELINDIKLVLSSLGCTCKEYIIPLSNGKKSYKLIIENTNPHICKIEDLGYKTEMRCIYVDDLEHLYLTNDYIVTHNTTLIRYFIDKLGLSLDEVMFVAYMGKAASQMARNGLPAITIHSAIYYYEKELARDDQGNLIYNKYGTPKKIGVFNLKESLGKKIRLVVVDEGSMVEPKIAQDILSFGIPTVVLGDLNQLPPVFGKPYFLKKPDVILRKIMRQAEDNPIVWLAQQVLADKEIKNGVYGTSFVIPKSDLTDYQMKKSDIILTETNRVRYNINTLYREQYKRIKDLSYPHIGEKVICRKNNWNNCIGDGIYLTNGTAGFVDDIYKNTFNGKTMEMDFRPDFTNKVFKHVNFSYNHLYEVPGVATTDEPDFSDIYNDKMEFAYAITTHASQGSQYPNVLFMNENMMGSYEDRKKLMYTAITRAILSIGIVR